jgi:hypothetical protein
VTEGALQLGAESEAGGLGLLWHHCARSQLCRGPRGFPDLIALGSGGLAAVELKTPAGTLSPDQRRWGWAWRAAGLRYVVATDLAAVRKTLEEIAH